MEQTVQIVNNSAPRCPYCHEDISVQSEKTGCESCMAWHHKACWNEHSGCSACGKKASTQTPQSALAELQSPEVTERTCTEWRCERSPQHLVNAPGYDLRCEQHALRYGESKALHYKALMAIFGIMALAPAPLAILGTQTPDQVLTSFFVLTVGSVFMILILASDASKHERHRKTLRAMKKEKKEVK